MPRAEFSHTLLADAEAADVWQRLNRVETWGAIAGVEEVSDPVLDAEGRLDGFSFATVAAGRRYSGKATVRERVEQTTLAWDIANSELDGVIRVDLAPDGNGTSVTVGLEIEPAGALMALFFPAVTSAIGKGFPESVEDFVAQLAEPAAPG